MFQFAPRAIVGLIVLLGLASCAQAPAPKDAPAVPESIAVADAPAPIPPSGDPDLDSLVDAALVDGYAYEKLGELCDTVGPRLTGSPGMKRAIAWSEASTVCSSRIQAMFSSAKARKSPCTA